MTISTHPSSLVGKVIGQRIDVLTWDGAVKTIDGWARKRESRVVCICNAHSLVTANRDEEFATIIREADMATADGYPVAYLLRRQGNPRQERINGPDLMLRYCEEASRVGTPIYLLGGEPSTLELLREALTDKFPPLKIAGQYSPPFRQLTPAEDESIVANINASGAGVVWVGLGCPKQEQWMAAHRGRVNAVMVGVGAAFDYHAGTLQRAPSWMQHHGLEWLYRLLKEPRRLWRRYLITNSLFVWYALTQRVTRQ
jgi:N-acetylglucosaminyldiphosphoundecaprenol N-acetyl-beta-D-mannosaminyltransferase